MAVAVYDATGAILRVVVSSSPDPDAHAGPGEFAVEVGPGVSDLTHQIVDGIAVLITP